MYCHQFDVLFFLETRSSFCEYRNRICLIHHSIHSMNSTGLGTYRGLINTQRLGNGSPWKPSPAPSLPQWSSLLRLFSPRVLRTPSHDLGNVCASVCLPPEWPPAALSSASPLCSSSSPVPTLQPPRCPPRSADSCEGPSGTATQTEKKQMKKPRNQQ